jgi:hypothetical protein
MSQAINSRTKYATGAIRYVLTFDLKGSCVTRKHEVPQFLRDVAQSLQVRVDRTILKDISCIERGTMIRIPIHLLEGSEGEISPDEAIANLMIAISYGYNNLKSWNIRDYFIQEREQKRLIQLEWGPQNVLTMAPDSRYHIPFKSISFHQKLVDSLEFIQTIMTQNKITYWITGGTLVGVLRHGAIIPHDDDIDIEVFDVDLPKIIQSFQNFSFVSFLVRISMT